MCLEKKNIFIPNHLKEGIGYKFYTTHQYGEGLFAPAMNDGPYKIGDEIVDDRNGTIESDQKCLWWWKKYRTGFHFFENMGDCITIADTCQVIVKLQYSDVVAVGQQWGKVVIVAKHIKLLEIVRLP